MEAREHLYYGLGMLAYAVAKADGEIQSSEKRELHELVSEWSARYSSNYDITEIIFSLLDKTKPTLEQGLALGIKNIKLGSDHMNEQLKEHFIYLIQDIAHSFPPVTENEDAIINRVVRALDEV
ncbi:MAG: hypothetical protein Salg2KO_09950 [Salibacteraceae bacterium]